MSGDPVLAASNPAASAWVGANAGSGKTYVLTARVIRLLLDGTPPGRLLCLTYTRAAAAEMRARVFGTLGRWALMDEAALAAEIAGIEGARPDRARLARARRLFATALETPGGLKIQTIHAFCESLVARFPVEADVPVPISVMTESEAAHLRAVAREEALRRLGEGAAPLMETLAPWLSSKDFAQLFEGRSAALIAQQTGDPWAAAGLPTGLMPADVVAEAGYDDPQRISLLRAAVAVLLQGGATDQAVGEPLADGLLSEDAETRFELVTSAFFTKTGQRSPRKNIGTKPLRKANAGLFADFDIEIERAIRLVARRASAESAAMAHAVATLGRGVGAIYSEAKRAQGKLDFDDLIDKANALLEGPAAAWALYKLDGGLDHILIDEAQDTSPKQWSVVERLAAEFFAGSGARPESAATRTLFAVGDEKQSIYSFQGADPRQFAAYRALFAERAAGAGALFETPLLVTSRRSAPPVLELADAVFAPDAGLASAVSGGPWPGHVAHRSAAYGAVELWPLIEAEAGEEDSAWTRPVDAPRPEDPAARLAGALATAIKGWIGREQVDSEHGLRALQAGDVLILVRARGRLSKAIIRKLKQAGVPVAGADRLSLLDHIAVKDLIAYGRAALLPQDDLNLAALLRSPFFDLSEDALFRLAHGRSGSLWARLAEAAGDGAPFGIATEAAAAIRDRLTAAMNRLGRDAPFDFYARLLAEGGRKAMLARLGEEAEDVIDEFLSQAATAEDIGPPSLERFLHALESEGGEVKRDPDAAGRAVRVLTAHGAKGLEAPVVILPDTMSLPPASYTPNLLPFGDALVWKPSGSPEAEAAKADWRAAEHEEHKRLLYVALTRPRDRLIVCGVKPGKSPPKEAVTWYDAIQAGFARLDGCAPIETPAGPGVRHGRLPPPADAAPEAAADAPLPDWTATPLPREEAIGLVRPSRLTPDLSFADTAAAFGLERGRLIHRLLQSLPDLAPADRPGAAARFLAARGAMLDEAARRDIAGRVLAIIADPAFAAAFAPGSRAEAAIAGRVAALGPQGFISGQIDRLAVTESDVLIVDYKTNRSPPATAEAAPPAYLKQMALYREAMRAAFPGRAVRAALLWTETPALMDLPDSLLDAALARLAAA